ncbi:hypothetical protein [Croceibacterium aestuarii]|uniref:hypothetical protein n=1 Tax=Croceibacterium aestuarii TaxID=3064139 RepID=UPI00272E3487|nr:hypothetical protein [Croceibacterium sp. D39]
MKKTNALSIAIGSVAAGSLAIAQPAFAADSARSPSSSEQSEHLSGMASGAWIGIAAVLAVGIFAVINASNDDDPVSP